MSEQMQQTGGATVFSGSNLKNEEQRQRRPRTAQRHVSCSTSSIRNNQNSRVGLVGRDQILSAHRMDQTASNPLMGLTMSNMNLVDFDMGMDDSAIGGKNSTTDSARNCRRSQSDARYAAS